MSIHGAVSELNKEIERLIGIRDSLLQVESESAKRSSGLATPKPQIKAFPAARKALSQKEVPSKAKKSSPRKVASTKQPVPLSKRIVSEATRKKMSDAAKARSAAKKSSVSK